MVMAQPRESKGPLGRPMKSERERAREEVDDSNAPQEADARCAESKPGDFNLFKYLYPDRQKSTQT
jgi:hypothetical protein